MLRPIIQNEAHMHLIKKGIAESGADGNTIGGFALFN